MSTRPLLAVLLTLLSIAAWPQEQLKVATRIVPPFVKQDGNRLAGFSIDLWKNLADRLGVKSTYIVKGGTVDDLLKSVKTREADLAIAAISITSARDKDLDFSQPMCDAGLQIMAPAKDTGNAATRLWHQVVDSGVFVLLGVIFLIGLLPAHVVWISERVHPRCLLKDKAYFPGIFEAYWWSLATLATQAEEMPKSVLGRITAVFWMFTAVVFVAFFTAQVTASLTVQQLQGSIKGPQDLPGKKVATTAGSTSAAYLRDQHIDTVEFPRIEDVYDAITNGKVDAVVFDAPVLQYYVAHEGKGKFVLAGDIFKSESYGIAVAPNSLLRKRIDVALLASKEDGSYQELYDKWFSSK